MRITCAAPGRREGEPQLVALAMGPEKAVCVGVVGGGAHKEESERPDGKGRKSPHSGVRRGCCGQTTL